MDEGGSQGAHQVLQQIHALLEILWLIDRKVVLYSYLGPIPQSPHVVPYSQKYVHGIQLPQNWKIGSVDELKRYVDKCNVNKGKWT